MKSSLLSLVGVGVTPTPAPVNDLRKKEKVSLSERANTWVESNFYLICFGGLIICVVVFVGTCFMIVGLCGVESGMLRNFLIGGV